MIEILSHFRSIVALRLDIIRACVRRIENQHVHASGSNENEPVNCARVYVPFRFWQWHMFPGIDPKVDFAFKLLVGSPDHPRITIHFLNSV
jgi:hypothetical protein